MDWNALKNKAISLGNKAAEAGITALEKASEHTYEGIKKTAVSIKSGEDLDVAKSEPLLLLLVIGKEDAPTKTVLARLPMIFKDAWLCSATVRIVLAEETPELATVLGAVEYPVAIVFRKGEQERRFDGVAALEFIKNLDLSRPKPQTAAVPEGMVDVVAQAVAGNPVPVSVAMPGAAAAAVPVSAPVQPALVAPMPAVQPAPATPAPQPVTSEVPTPTQPAQSPDALVPNQTAPTVPSGPSPAVVPPTPASPMPPVVPAPVPVPQNPVQ